MRCKRPWGSKWPREAATQVYQWRHNNSNNLRLNSHCFFASRWRSAEQRGWGRSIKSISSSPHWKYTPFLTGHSLFVEILFADWELHCNLLISFLILSCRLTKFSCRWRLLVLYSKEWKFSISEPIKSKPDLDFRLPGAQLIPLPLHHTRRPFHPPPTPSLLDTKWHFWDDKCVSDWWILTETDVDFDLAEAALISSLSAATSSSLMWPRCRMLLLDWNRMHMNGSAMWTSPEHTCPLTS